MIRLDIPRMNSNKCRITVADALLGVDPAANCNFDLDRGSVAVESKLPPSDFIEALEEVGYKSFIAQG
jgi:copper chaperone CopZ